MWDSGIALEVAMLETLDRGSILHHVTDCEDLSIEPSILIEYQWK